jgi:hypothetical protein
VERAGSGWIGPLDGSRTHRLNGLHAARPHPRPGGGGDVHGAIDVLLGWTIAHPLARLSAAATRIAAGERKVYLPSGGGGEITELAESIRAMTDRLGARLKYISEFSADVAHEFESPLTSIRGAAELLSEGAADDPEARERFLRNISLDFERLDRLIMDLGSTPRISPDGSIASSAPRRTETARVSVSPSSRAWRSPTGARPPPNPFSVRARRFGSSSP